MDGRVAALHAGKSIVFDSFVYAIGSGNGHDPNLPVWENDASLSMKPVMGKLNHHLKILISAIKFCRPPPRKHV